MIDLPPSNPLPVPPPSPPLSVAQFEDMKARWRFTQVNLEGPRVLVSGIDLDEIWALVLSAELAVNQAEAVQTVLQKPADGV